MGECDQPVIVIPVEFIGAISHSSSIEQVLMTAAERLPHIVGSEYSVVKFLDEDAQISRAFCTGGATGLFGSDTKIYPGTLGAKVVKTGEPILVSPDMLRAATKGLMPKMYAAGIRSALIAPMKSGGVTVGALTIAGTHETGFDDQQVCTVVALGKWIASQARLMQQVRRTARLAETDSLTGLANRSRLRRVLNGPQALHRADKLGRVVGVLHIDLDHFKEVNDTLGHAAGDALLTHCAKAMLHTVGPKDLVARIGGDEFVVVTRTDPGGARLSELAQDLVIAIGRPLILDDVEVRVGASIGTAIASRDDCTGDRLIGNADMALYEVKRKGRGGVYRFDDEMRKSNERRMRLLSDLRNALDQDQFLPYFQPQVSLSTGCFSGFEMLARWTHPDLGILDPVDFLHLGKETGLSHQIDEMVRRKGLDALKRLREDGWDAPKMSFNASSRTLSSPNLIEALSEEVSERGLRPCDLVLEVREADLRELGRDRALQTMMRARDEGFLIELDDFGRGFASIATLAQAPISALKLGGGMVGLLPAERALTIVNSAAQLAHQLGMTVTAEQVETPEQFSLLREAGCDHAQGFGISQPLEFNELVSFMQGYGQAPVDLAKVA